MNCIVSLSLILTILISSFFFYSFQNIRREITGKYVQESVNKIIVK
mgnify:CR=1 FL=1